MTTNGESGTIMKIAKDKVDIKHVYDKIKEIAESKNLLLQKEIEANNAKYLMYQRRGDSSRTVHTLDIKFTYTDEEIHIKISYFPGPNDFWAEENACRKALLDYKFEVHDYLFPY